MPNLRSSAWCEKGQAFSAPFELPRQIKRENRRFSLFICVRRPGTGKMPDSAFEWILRLDFGTPCAVDCKANLAFHQPLAEGPLLHHMNVLPMCTYCSCARRKDFRLLCTC